MKDLNSLKHFDRLVYAASLDEAYKEGYFSGSMTRTEFMNRVIKFNPQLRWYESPRAAGLFDSLKGQDQKAFICSIGKSTTIPAFTILKYDTKQDRQLHRSNEWGEVLYTETFNMDNDKFKCLARSWRAMFNAIKSLGYEVDDEDLF